MKVIYNLLSGGNPPPIDLPYNGDTDVDSDTKRYKGSLVKLTDYGDVDHGRIFTFAGETTAMENVAGILEEEQPASTSYLPDDGTYGIVYKKITPVFSSSVIEAEYSRKDAAGTANTDTSATGSAASASMTVTIGTADWDIGGWVYFLTGANAGFLHYVTDNSTSVATLSPVLNYALVTTDTYLFINPPNGEVVLIDATYTGLKSEISDTSRSTKVCGLTTWIEAPGIGKTKLDFAKHAGLKIPDAKFYHQFTLPGTATLPNYWNGSLST